MGRCCEISVMGASGLSKCFKLGTNRPIKESIFPDDGRLTLCIVLVFFDFFFFLFLSEDNCDDFLFENVRLGKLSILS